MGKVIEAVGITKNFRQPNGEILTVLNKVDLDIHEGEMVAIMGPSGSGKSTLLHILGLMSTLDAGSLSILGHDVASLNSADQDMLRQRQIGFLFQFDSLLEELTVRENCRLVGRIRAPEVSLESSSAAIKSWAGKLGLSGKLDAYPRGLSVGECCRANLIKALLGRPKILFADEPTGNLDSKNAKQLIMEFLGLVSGFGEASGKMTIVLATHNREIASQANRTLALAEGKLCPVGF